MALSRDEKRLSIGILMFTVFVTAIVLAPLPITSIPDDVEIPVLMDVSGPNGEFGVDYVRGMQMAVDDLGPNSRYSIKVYDTEGDMERTLEQFAAIVATGSPLMIGPLTSDEALAIPIEESGIVCISPSVSADPMKDVDGFYRTHCNDSYSLEAVAKVLQKGGTNKVAVLYTVGNFGSEAQKDTFSSICEEKFPGIAVVPVGLSEDVEDVSRASKELLDDEVDAVLTVTATPEEFERVYKVAKEMGLDSVCIGTEILMTEAIAKLEGVYILTATRSVSLSDFMDRFEDIYGNPPINAMYGYDVVNIVKEVIDFNGYDRDSIVKGLDRIRFMGLIGLITFDEHGECIPAFDTLAGIDGRWTVVNWSEILQF